MAYRARLENEHASVISRIEKNVLGGESLDVVWNMTLAANIISANVLYGQMEEMMFSWKISTSPWKMTLPRQIP